MIPKCKLCGRAEKLCQSHVIPEFVFKPIYDEKHRMRELTDRRKNTRALQKGLREPLLCEGCEQHINTWKRYFKEAWYDHQLGPHRAPDDLIVVRGLDYSKFRLFHLSVLWRAGVATRREFAQVTLGPHEPRLRKMLLNADPGSEELYPLFAYLLVFGNDNSVCSKMVGICHRVRISGQWGYQFLFGGAVWNHIVSSHDAPQHAGYRFNTLGELRLLRVAATEYGPIGDLFRVRREQGWTTRKDEEKP